MELYKKFKEGYRIDKEKIGTIDIINTVVRVLGFIVLFSFLIYLLSHFYKLSDTIDLCLIFRKILLPRIFIFLPILLGFVSSIICEILRRVEKKRKYKNLTEGSKENIKFLKYIWFNYLELLSVMFFTVWTLSILKQQIMLFNFVLIYSFGVVISLFFVIILSFIFRIIHKDIKRMSKNIILFLFVLLSICIIFLCLLSCIDIFNGFKLKVDYTLCSNIHWSEIEGSNFIHDYYDDFGGKLRIVDYESYKEIWKYYNKNEEFPYNDSTKNYIIYDKLSSGIYSMNVKFISIINNKLNIIIGAESSGLFLYEGTGAVLIIPVDKEVTIGQVKYVDIMDRSLENTAF